MDKATSGIGPGSVVARRLDARVRNIRTALLVAGPEQALELNATAAFVWKKIDGRRTLREIATALAAEYGVAADTVLDDVLGVISDLAECRVITTNGAT